MGHGNSLRALIKDLEGLSDDAIAELEIPNAVASHPFRRSHWIPPR